MLGTICRGMEVSDTQCLTSVISSIPAHMKCSLVPRPLSEKSRRVRGLGMRLLK